MNEILFLGTGAADWSISDKGEFFRRNSAALINNDLMIDCGEHIFDFANTFADESLYDGVENIIITHNHSDHFSKESVLKLFEKHKIKVGCDEKIASILGEHKNIEFEIFEPFSEKTVGNYKIIPLLANHDIVADKKAYAFHYIIETKDGKKLFYGLDGAWFLRPSWEEMKKHKFDVMIFDCTVGDFHDWRIFEHNTIPMLREMTKEIFAQNMLKENGSLIASHFARTLHGSHLKTKEILDKIKVITAYDGFKAEF